MAFRIEARIGAVLALAAGMMHAQAVEVRHKHLRHGGAGRLEVTEDGISFTEAGKGAKHSRAWKYQEIQQLELTADTLRILTYEDQKWKLGLDREYLFDGLPADFAPKVYPDWRSRLDQRFIAAIPEKDLKPLWEIPAKLLATIQGSQGVLKVGEDRIVYETDQPGTSRTWRYSDVENVSSAGRFDLSIQTREHHSSINSGSREFRFQLKRPLDEGRYNDLWRRLNRSAQSDFLRTAAQPQPQLP
jgi:hypothetical protein